MATVAARARVQDAAVAADVAPQETPGAALRLCGRAARFRRLTTALERARIDADRGRAHARLEARYPAAAKDAEHDDRIALDALRIVHAGYGPLIRGCWANDDEAAPTPEELEGADPAELDACIAEIYRLNPVLGGAGPN